MNNKLTFQIAQRYVSGEKIDLRVFGRVEMRALELLATRLSDFSFLREIDWRQAEILAAACNELVLDGLSTIDDQSARILGEKHLGSLSLRGLTTLSKSAAKSLSLHKGSINGIKPGAFVTQMRTRPEVQGIESSDQPNQPKTSQGVSRVNTRNAGGNSVEPISILQKQSGLRTLKESHAELSERAPTPSMPQHAGSITSPLKTPKNTQNLSMPPSVPESAAPHSENNRSRPLNTPTLPREPLFKHGIVVGLFSYSTWEKHIQAITIIFCTISAAVLVPTLWIIIKEIISDIKAWNNPELITKQTVQNFSVHLLFACAFIVFPFVLYYRVGKNCGCPECRLKFVKMVDPNESTRKSSDSGFSKGWGTVVRKDEIKDTSGKHIATIERKEQVEGTYHHSHSYWKCRECGYAWKTMSSFFLEKR